MSNNSLISSFQYEELTNSMKNVNEFKTLIGDLSKTWEHLILLSQLSSSNINMDDTKADFDLLTLELSKHLENETLKKVVSQMNSKAQVTVDIVIRNLFERTADIGFLATDNDIRNFLIDSTKLKKAINLHKTDEDDTEFIVLNMKYKERVTSIRERFKEYVAKYSVYYDIVLFDKNKNILLKMEDSNLIETSEDEVLNIAKNTSAEYVETYKKHDFLPHKDETLVYTYRVTKDDNSEEVIGFLSLCFKFKDEMEGIFKNLVEKRNKEVLLLLDKEGTVLASSDTFHVPLKAKMELNLKHDYTITQFAGRDYLIKTCETNGYEGFYGLGWLGHIMIPLDSAFNTHTKAINIEDEILYSIMQNDKLFDKELLNIPITAEHIQNQLDRAVWNGNLIKIEMNNSSAEFTRSILREIKNTGEKTKKSFSTSIEKLNQTIITSLLDHVTFLASLSIDIMDRNLYERANDCRWWALTATFRDILSQKHINQEDVDKISSVLKYINSLYTVYTNLFIYDLDGRVIAVSNDKYKKIISTKINEDCLAKSLKLSDSSKYSVSSFESSLFYENESTYIYSAAIRDSKNKIIGGIGVVFDSKEQFKDMLIDALPQEKENTVDGIFSLFVEKESKKIINSSNNSFEIGSEFDFERDFFHLENNQSLSKIIEFKEKYYIVGAKCSNGYREYKSRVDDYQNDVIAFVFIEAGDINKKTMTINKELKNDIYKYQLDKYEDYIEIATFYIGDKWLGVPVKDVIETISVDSLEPVISLDDEKHFKGTVVYKNFIVSVLDIFDFIKTKNSYEPELYKEIVLVSYNGSGIEHRLGLTVSKLGEIIKVPKKNIRNIETHFIDGGVIGESIVVPPENIQSKNLLTLINISKIGILDTKNDNIL